MALAIIEAATRAARWIARCTAWTMTSIPLSGRPARSSRCRPAAPGPNRSVPTPPARCCSEGRRCPMSQLPIATNYDLSPLRRQRAQAAGDPRGSGTTIRRDTPHETKRAICRTAFDAASPISTSPTSTAPPARRRNGVRRDPEDGLRRAARRTRDLVQGRLSDVARPPTANGAAASTLSSVRGRASSGWGSTMSTSSISHRFDPDTPLEETMGALDAIVRSGKALYVGLSSTIRPRTRAAAILTELGTPA